MSIVKWVNDKICNKILEYKKLVKIVILPKLKLVEGYSNNLS